MSRVAAWDRLQFGNVEVELVEFDQLGRASSCAAASSKSAGFPRARGEAGHRQRCLLRLEEQARQGIQSSILAAERADQLSYALTTAHDQIDQSSRELMEAKETIALQTAELADYKRRLEARQILKSDAAGEREDAAGIGRSGAAAGRSSGIDQHSGIARASYRRLRSERAQLQHRLEQRDAESRAIRATSTCRRA